jgi:ABC-type Na+ transport system ATPase subunit NatA
MLSLRGLSRRYGQTVALDSLSLDVPEGEVVGWARIYENAVLRTGKPLKLREAWSPAMRSR